MSTLRKQKEKQMSFNLHQLAKRLGVSVRAIGRMVGVCDNTVYQWVMGTRIPRRPTQRLLQMLWDDPSTKVVLEQLNARSKP